MFPPAIFFDDVHTAIAVYIADAKPMSETLVIPFGSNGMKFPGCGGVFPIGFGVAEVTAGTANDFGFAIAVDVSKGRGFVVHHVKNHVLLPVALAALRVFVPGSVLAGKSVGEDVEPAVVIEIVGEGEKVVRVGIVGTVSAFETGENFFGAVGFLMFERGIGGIKFVAIGEVGSFVPIRPGDNVINPIVIEIPKGRAFSPELVDAWIYVLDVAAGDKMPRKGGPGITRSDLLVINKIDLAPYVGASLELMARDTKKVRGDRPFVFSNLKDGTGLDVIVRWVKQHLTAADATRVRQMDGRLPFNGSSAYLVHNHAHG